MALLRRVGNLVGKCYIFLSEIFQFCPPMEGESLGHFSAQGVELQVLKLCCSYLPVQPSAAHVGTALKGQVKCGND